MIYSAQYGNSDFDVRHLINANAIYELPFGKSRKFFNGVNKWADAVIGGWTMTGNLPLEHRISDWRHVR